HRQLVPAWPRREMIFRRRHRMTIESGPLTSCQSATPSAEESSSSTRLLFSGVLSGTKKVIPVTPLSHWKKRCSGFVIFFLLLQKKNPPGGRREGGKHPPKNSFFLPSPRLVVFPPPFLFPHLGFAKGSPGRAGGRRTHLAGGAPDARPGPNPRRCPRLEQRG